VDLPRPRTIEMMDSSMCVEYRRRIRVCLTGDIQGERATTAPEV